MQQSTKKHPLGFFDYYLNKRIYVHWNEYREGMVKNVLHSSFDEIDETNKIIKVLDSEDDKKSRFKYHSSSFRFRLQRS